MTIDISNNDPRISYSVAQGTTQTTFAIPFEFFDDSDVKVYVDGSLQTITTDYTISGGDGSTGQINMSVTGASGGSTVVLIREITIERTTDFTAGADINRAALNTQLDTLTGIAADTVLRVNRSIQLSEFDEGQLVLPERADRINKFIAFDSDGNLETLHTVGEYKGNWSALTQYFEKDLVKDSTNSNIYISLEEHTSSEVFANDLSSGKWALLVDAESATTSAANAAASEAAAETSKLNAAASESAAATSEINAAASETAAAASEAAASASESAAALSASAASASETAAASSETNAASSATSAATSATNAATSETNAATSATNAASSASLADSEAANAAGSASDAATSATAAASSATAAASSATDSSNSATAAAASKVAAATSETAAATSETNAALSASNAASSETAAALSETNAASSASAASTSETNAATSASSAATSATNAATSETNAANSATAAASSATNASSSATSAATQASNAQAAADSALAALDSFDDRYLGQKTSDPTTDNDGNPLVAGALYFNTTDDVMKVYEGSAWVAAYASLSGALTVANNLSDVADVASARTNLGLGTAATTASTDYATAAQGVLADSAVQLGDSPSFGSVSVTGTVDGRDIAADGAKLDGLNAADYATAAQGVLADSAVQPGDLATVASSGDYNDLINKPSVAVGESIVATGTISGAGIAVSLRADGTVEATAQTNVSLSISSATQFSSAHYNQSTIYHAPTNQVIVCHSVGTDIYAAVGVVSGGAITFLSNSVVLAGAASSDRTLMYSPSLDKLIIAYKDAATGYAKASVGTITGSSVTFNTPYVVNNSDGVGSLRAAYNEHEGKLVVVWSSQGASYGYSFATTSTISGTVITTSSSTAIISAYSFPMSMLYDPTSKKCVLTAYWNSGTGFNTPRALLLEVASGITVPSSVDLVTGVNIGTLFAECIEPVANKLVFVTKATSVYVSVVSVSGTTLSLDATTTPFYVTNLNGLDIAYDPLSEKVHFFFNDNTSGTRYLVSYSGSMSGSTITWDTPFTLVSTPAYQVTCIPSTTGDPMYIVRRSTTNDGYAYAYTAAHSSTNASEFIGFAQASASSGAAVNVALPFDVDANQSALTPATTYYIDADGSLSTVNNGYPIAGYALTSSKLLVGHTQ